MIFECSHDAAFKMCSSEFSFQNVPFSKSIGKQMCRFRVNGEAYPSHFSPFSNVLASFEHSLIQFSINFGLEAKSKQMIEFSLKISLTRCNIYTVLY